MVRELLEPLRKLLLGISLLRQKTEQTLDIVLSFGERLSTSIVAELVEARGLPAVFADSREWMVTDDTFSSARVDWAATRERIEAVSEQWADRVPICTGFLGQTPDGRTTTLGRNGSDYTATLLGRGLEAEEVIICTDVSGVMPADPFIVEDAYPVASLSYLEALELANYGASIFHNRTMLPLIESGIPMRIRNTREWGARGRRQQKAGHRTLARIPRADGFGAQSPPRVSLRDHRRREPAGGRHAPEPGAHRRSSHLVEGAFSGTLGYLTNEVMKGVPMSQAVRTARELGGVRRLYHRALSGLPAHRAGRRRRRRGDRRRCSERRAAHLSKSAWALNRDMQLFRVMCRLCLCVRYWPTGSRFGACGLRLSFPKPQATNPSQHCRKLRVIALNACRWRRAVEVMGPRSVNPTHQEPSYVEAHRHRLRNH